MSTLLRKNTRYLMTWLPFILLICCYAFYILMQRHAHHMQEKQLELKQQNVWTAFIKNGGNELTSVPGEHEIIKQGTNAVHIKNKSGDTSILLSYKDELLPFKYLSSEFYWNNERYLVTAFVSSTEISHLVMKVFAAESGILLILLLSIFLLNMASSKALWKPFYSTLRAVDDYNITRNQSLQLSKETGIQEFDRLNEVLVNLVEKVNVAYVNQKHFVENASHEIQTPLAIIRSKLELLINQPELSKETALQLAAITRANDRLSEMNRSLLLLAKIDNNQFPDTASINFSKLLQEDILTFQEHYDAGFPTLKLELVPGKILNANPALLEILIFNLIKNAVEHNVPGGRLTVKLFTDRLMVQNTGHPPNQPAEKLFNRFEKGSHRSRSTGLGLSLVKEICMLYGYDISYKYNEGLHTIEIKFAP